MVNSSKKKSSIPCDSGRRYSRLAQLLQTFPSSSNCEVILYAGVTRAMEVPGRLATGERTSVPGNFRTLYRTGENPSVPRLSHLPTNLEGKREREREFSRFFFRLPASSRHIEGEIYEPRFDDALPQRVGKIRTC